MKGRREGTEEDGERGSSSDGFCLLLRSEERACDASSDRSVLKYNLKKKKGAFVGSINEQ